METLASGKKNPQIYPDVKFLSQKKVLIYATDFLLLFVWRLSQIHKSSAYS